MNQQNPIPAPQIIDGELWTVQDSGEDFLGYVDFETKRMVVPMTNTVTGNFIRAHETTHVAITPRKLEKVEGWNTVENRTLQALEDARVAVALNKAKINTDLELRSENEILGMAMKLPIPPGQQPPNPILEMARCYAATYKTRDQDRMREHIPAEVAKACDKMLDHFYKPYEDQNKIPPFETVIKMAQEMEEFFKQPPTPEPEPNPNGDPSNSDGDEEQQQSAPADGNWEPKPGDNEGEGDGEGQDGDGEEAPKPASESPKPKKYKKPGNIVKPFDPKDKNDLMPAPKPELTKAESKMLDNMGLVSGGSPSSYAGTIEGVTMLVTEPRRPIRLKPGKAFGLKRVPSDTGTIPKNMTRYATDMAVFSQLRKKGFGAVLIDYSGSMRLDPKDVEEMMGAIPHATIAAYSGYHSARKGQYAGEMVILAKDGKRVEKIPPSHGENMVDYEALKWLSKQHPPRIWVSDAIVTGPCGSHGGPGRLDSFSAVRLAHLCKAANIKRVRYVSDIFKKKWLGEYAV